MLRLVLGVLAIGLACLPVAASATYIVTLEWDAATCALPGALCSTAITNDDTISVPANQTGLTADVFLDMTTEPLGTAGYGISFMWNVGDLVNPSATEVIPPGFLFNLTPGVDCISQPGKCLTMDAAPFPGTAAGGGLKIFAGTLTVDATAVPSTVISSGLFNVGVDAVLLASGFVAPPCGAGSPAGCSTGDVWFGTATVNVPEPRALGLLLVATLPLGLYVRSRVNA